jgi:hypothetical protein
VDVAALYDTAGPYARWPAALPGLIAWAAGAVTYSAAGAVGGTLPSLVVAALTYLTLGVRRSRIP